MRLALLVLASAVCSLAQCSISITAPSSGTFSGPTVLSATSTSCPSVVRHEYRINSQPLMGDGFFEYSYAIPDCHGGTCFSTYVHPTFGGSYNISYNWDGVYPLTVQALDATGAVVATSSAVNVTVNDQGFGACSLTSPNFGSAQSGTITITQHCPLSGVPGSSVWSNAYYNLYVDGQLVGGAFETNYPDQNWSFDTTTLENGTHLVWVATSSSLTPANTSPGNAGQSPILGSWGLLTTANTNHARELRLSHSTVILWLGGTTTDTLTPRIVNCDNTESSTSATYVSADATVATVGVSSGVVTAVASGVTTITATSGSLTRTVNVMVNSGTPIFPHFGTDGSICTAYNSGNCAPNKSFLVRSMFDNGAHMPGTSRGALRTATLLSAWNVFENPVYINPANISYPSYASWQGQSNQAWAGSGGSIGLDATLAAGFKAILGMCASTFQDGATGQSTSDGNGSSSDGQGFANRMAWLAANHMNGKVVGCLSVDEDPIPLIKGYGSGQMGTTNGPSQIVVSGGTATVTWPSLGGAGYHADITNATNTCFNSSNITLPGPLGGPFTFSTGCSNGTYNSGTDPNLVIWIYNDLCSGPCQNLAPLNIKIPNSVYSTIRTALQAATPPIGMSFSWQGGAGTAVYALAASVSDFVDNYFTWDGPENGGVNRGYPSGRLIRMPMLQIENKLWGRTFVGMNRATPFLQLVHAAGSWFARGGKTFTLSTASGSQFTTTTANNAAVGAMVYFSGSGCTGNYFDVASVQSSTSFTVSQSPGCSSGSGTVIISSTNPWFTPPLDRWKQAAMRNVEIAAETWDAFILGAAGTRIYTYSPTNGCGPGTNNYPATAADAYTDNNVPYNNPNGENCNTGLTENFTDNPSAGPRWRAVGVTQQLIGILEPQIIAPVCNAPDFGPRFHTGAKCGSLGTLVIAINDSESPATLNFPASLWSAYNSGAGTITRYEEIKAAYVKTTNLSAGTSTDSLSVDGGEIAIWWFPASAANQTAKTVSMSFNLAEVGGSATQAAVRWSYLCDASTNPPASNLDQQAPHIVSGSPVSLTLHKPPSGPICFDYQYLDNSNNPVGKRSSVQVLN